MSLIKIGRYRANPSEFFTGIIKYRDGSRLWYQNGKLHRTDGPAVMWAKGENEYWINGEPTYKEAVEVFNKLFPKEISGPPKKGNK